MHTLYTLTALDVAAIRAADCCVIRFAPDAPPVRFIKRAPEPTARVPFPQEQEHTIAAPVTFKGYDSGTDYSQATAVFVVHLYRFSPGVLASLRAGDAIGFHVVADNNTDHLRNAGLHCDAIEVRFRRGKTTFDATLDYRVGPDNSARSVKGTATRVHSLAEV